MAKCLRWRKYSVKTSNDQPFHSYKFTSVQENFKKAHSTKIRYIRHGSGTKTTRYSMTVFSPYRLFSVVQKKDFARRLKNHIPRLISKVFFWKTIGILHNSLHYIVLFDISVLLKRLNFLTIILFFSKTVSKVYNGLLRTNEFTEN